MVERTFEYEIGDRVESKAIGMKGRFEGVIADRKISDNNNIFYLVADVKDLWHRDAKDLRKVES